MQNYGFYPIVPRLLFNKTHLFNRIEQIMLWAQDKLLL